VPKKKFRNAVDRNRVKRLLREAWRLNKHLLYAAVAPEDHLHIFLIFTDNKLPETPAITVVVTNGLLKLAEQIGKQQQQKEL